MDVVQVKVGKVGGKIEEYAVNGDKTVASALRTAGLAVGAGEEIRVNSNPATLATVLRNGDVVLVVKQTKGA